MPEDKTTTFIQKNRGLLITLLVFILLPFIVGLLDGANPLKVWSIQVYPGIGDRDLYSCIVCAQLRPDLWFYRVAFIWSFNVLCRWCIPDWNFAKEFWNVIKRHLWLFVARQYFTGIALWDGAAKGQGNNLCIGDFGDGFSLPCIGHFN